MAQDASDEAALRNTFRRCCGSLPGPVRTDLRAIMQVGRPIRVARDSDALLPCPFVIGGHREDPSALVLGLDLLPIEEGHQRRQTFVLR